ncbi:MAG TPA: alpha/beta hydrolase [candidate division Zixibacteria bacterium]|nr:alpha/beta hydrolase [candidate division Zixibacteria bacterium]HEQ98084.1 alpha/beta hydrolase [candidate division Zixibacteria bacterium]
MLKYSILSLLSLLILLALPGYAQETIVPDQDLQPLGIAMENYDYPYQVQYLALQIEGQDVRMAFMDIRPPANPNGMTVLLFHGKNFFGAYWEKTIEFLSNQGYRVIVPDQIGFGKSSKPNIHYSFHRLAENTRKLLEVLGVDKVSLVGHSMGGMLAVRFSLMYPETVSKLILENPIGLEDYRLKVPYTPVESAYENILNYTEDGLRDYHRTYYVDWKDEYDEYVMVHYRWTLGGEYPRLAMASALTFEMVYTQPVVYELPRLEMPTLLVIGQEDRTTLGRGTVEPEVLATLGQYPELGKKAAAMIPDSKLVELENVGHIPHFEATERFHDEIIEFLK